MQNGLEYYRITIMDGKSPMRDLCLDDFDPEMALESHSDENLLFFDYEKALGFAQIFAKEHSDLGLKEPVLFIKLVQDGDIVDYLPVSTSYWPEASCP
jgi:hypothetical protein